MSVLPALRQNTSTWCAVPKCSIGNPVGEMAQPLPGASTAATGLRGKQA
jgi:hypothetical protein